MSLPDYKAGALADPDGAVRPYVTFGAGKNAMVIVPGAADGLITCADVAVYLAWFYRHRAENCRLLILSRRDPLPEGYGQRQHAHDMIRTVEELGIGPAVWECISASGPIGQWAAVLRPDLVPGLILSSTYDYVTGRTRQVLQQWSSLADQAGSDFLWNAIEPLYRPPADILSRLDPASLPNAASIRDSTRLKRLLSELLELDQREIVSRITSATMVIAGVEDRIVPIEIQREMAHRIQGSRLELCPGYGHFNDMQNPAYQHLVERHLQAVCTPKGGANGASPRGT